MIKFKKILISLLAVVSICGQNNIVFAQTFCDEANPKPEICIEIDKGGAGTTPTDNPVTKTLKSIMGMLSYVIGIASVVMVIIGAFKYILSHGDANSISSAKNTIAFALVGLVIAIMAQAIVKFVLNKL